MDLTLLFIGSLIGAIVIGLPIAFALLLSGGAMMWYVDFGDAQIFALNLIGGANSYTLLSILFFIVAGEVMVAGGLSERIVRLALTLVGDKKAGLGFVAIFAAVVMASLSGSAVADTAALSAILLPMMRQAQYPERNCVGLLAAGGIIAPMIPPSIPLILMGVAGEISIKALFMAGIVPGLCMAIGLMVYWKWHTRNINLPISPKATTAQIVLEFKNSFWAIMLPIIVIGGIKTGMFTPTEAGVVVAVYSIFISTVVYRSLSLRQLFHSLGKAARNTSVILFLVAAATVVAWMVSFARLPDMVREMLLPLVDHPMLLMLVIMLVVMLVGMVMDLTPTILVLTPILIPLIKTAGIDPVYFGVMFVLNCSIGLITPPVGNVLNVICSVGKVSFVQASRGVAPYVVLYLALLALFIIFPQLIIVPYQFLIN